MSTGRRAVIERVADDVVSRNGLGHPLRVGIDGRSAAGKTTFADELATTLEARGVSVLRASIDDFHPKGYKFRSRQDDWTPELCLGEGFDYAAFRRLVLEPLGPGGSRLCRLKVLNAGTDEAYPEEWTESPPGAIAVCDAAFAFVPELADAWDLTVWLDVSLEAMFARAEERDVAWTGSREAVRERYEAVWMPTHLLYERLYSSRERADWVIDNEEFDQPRVRRPLQE
jgi:uridine kinase